MLNWLLCLVIGHVPSHVKTLKRDAKAVMEGKAPLIRVFVCKRCMTELTKDGWH